MENKDNKIEMIEEEVKKPKETHIEYCRRYYKENREKHLAYINTKVDCAICGKQFARCRIQRHKKSNVHLLNQKLKELETELVESKKK